MYFQKNIFNGLFLLGSIYETTQLKNFNFSCHHQYYAYVFQCTLNSINCLFCVWRDTEWAVELMGSENPKNLFSQQMGFLQKQRLRSEIKRSTWSKIAAIRSGSIAHFVQLWYKTKQWVKNYLKNVVIAKFEISQYFVNNT